MTKTGKVLWQLIIAALLLILALVSASIAFGWFYREKGVSATGMEVSALGAVEIRATADGPDISVTVPDKDMTLIENGVNRPADGSDSNAFRPGAAGKFTFYVHNDFRSDYTVFLDIDVVNNQFADNGYEGWLPGSSEENRKRALQYINSHLMFFTDYDETDGYSGWIPPDGMSRFPVSPQDGTAEITLYWIWVPWYSDIFSADRGVIAEEQRQAIADYYTLDENREKMFNGDIGELEFNEADYVIGTTLEFVSFDIHVQGE